MLSWAGPPWFPAASAVSLRSPVLNPKPWGPSSWRQSFHPLVTHRVLQGPTLSHRRWQLTVLFKSQAGSSSETPFSTPPTIDYTCQRTRSFCFSELPWLVRAGVAGWRGANRLQALARVLCRGSCLPARSCVKVKVEPGSLAQINYSALLWS